MKSKQLIFILLINAPVLTILLSCSKNNSTNTTASLATITTNPLSQTTDTSVIIGGNITSDGGASITSRGVCWGTASNPTIALNMKNVEGSGIGNFSSLVKGLNRGTTYYFRAFATNSTGTAYGNEITFSTNTIPTLTTIPATQVRDTSVLSGGNITSDGGASITSRGVCWSTSVNPTIALTTKITNGSGTGDFLTLVRKLTAGTTYYLKAYATNSVGTAYGNEISVTTSANAPTVTTNSASNIGTTVAASGGNVTSDGGNTVTARGVCWSTAQNPTVALSTKTIDGTGLGNFSSAITGLTPGLTYYLRAYATNSIGTRYGNQISFTSSSGIQLTTLSIFNRGLGYISTGGYINSSGGLQVIQRGLCYSQSQNPTINSTYRVFIFPDPSPIPVGSYSIDLQLYGSNKTYYFRAYALDQNGIPYYGNQLTFTTP